MKGWKSALIIVLGFASLYPMQRWIDTSVKPPSSSEDVLYLSSGETIRRMSVGLSAIVADIYWIRTVQYFGRKLVESDKRLSAATKDIDMPLLAPLLNIVTALDPHHTPAYRFGAIFLPERDMDAAIALLEKGHRENPTDWGVCRDLAYIYWQSGNGKQGEAQAEDYAKASRWYEIGSGIEGAPWWMNDMVGVMKIKGESREVAYTIYRSYLDSDDEKIRIQALARLKQLRSLDELDAINGLIERFRQQRGQCPGRLRELAPALSAMGLKLNSDLEPVDPDGFAYDYKRAECKAALVFESTINR
ncbi:MAG TPA: tetratricopeptide repeat protein [Blastocatellia bacterium]|nr:tetratricopeptide repeat protein [Blastocatellia bacterium]